MSQAPTTPHVSEPTSEPVWDIARLFPDQGTWSEDDYLALDTNHLVEFVDGFIEVLPMPTLSHQLIVMFLRDLLQSWLTSRKRGTVVVAPYKVQLRRGKYREPDIVVMFAEHHSRLGEQHADSADLVMEVVSPENRPHDLEKKRIEYAQAGIPEYWIVDPQEGCILVLTLDGSSYTLHGAFERGGTATSKLLPGFTVDVSAVFAAVRP